MGCQRGSEGQSVLPSSSLRCQLWVLGNSSWRGVALHQLASLMYFLFATAHLDSEGWETPMKVMCLSVRPFIHRLFTQCPQTRWKKSPRMHSNLKFHVKNFPINKVELKTPARLDDVVLISSQCLHLTLQFDSGFRVKEVLQLQL